MKRLISAVAVSAVAIMAFASVASADVARYQTTHSITLDTLYNGVDFVPHYTIDMNPCVNNSFTGGEKGGISVGRRRDRLGHAQRLEHQDRRRVPRRVRVYLELQRPARGRQHWNRQSRSDVEYHVHYGHEQLQEPRRVRRVTGRRLRRGPLVHRDARSLKGIDHQLFLGGGLRAALGRFGRGADRLPCQRHDRAGSTH